MMPFPEHNINISTPPSPKTLVPFLHDSELALAIPTIHSPPSTHHVSTRPRPADALYFCGTFAASFNSSLLTTLAHHD